MNRRSFLAGVAAAVAAPYVITTPGLLMPVRKIWTPQSDLMFWEVATDGTLILKPRREVIARLTARAATFRPAGVAGLKP